MTHNWPLVHARDDGIRPAGKPDECFYCRKKIGEPHAPDCAIVTKRVLLLIKSLDGSLTGTWELDVTHSFQPEMIEYMKNDGTWCANNIFDYDEIEWDQLDAWADLELMSKDGCLCDKLRFEFVRVVDDTPQRKLVNP